MDRQRAVALIREGDAVAVPPRNDRGQVRSSQSTINIVYQVVDACVIGILRNRHENRRIVVHGEREVGVARQLPVAGSARLGCQYGHGGINPDPVGSLATGRTINTLAGQGGEIRIRIDLIQNQVGRVARQDVGPSFSAVVAAIDSPAVDVRVVHHPSQQHLTLARRLCGRHNTGDGLVRER